jgi:hypothetical protein
MKSKTLASLVVVLVVAGLLALVASLVRESQVQKAGEGIVKAKVVPGFPVNEVTAVTVSAKGTNLNLARKEGVWSVQERGGYRADFEKVGNLLRDVYDLGIVEHVLVGPSKFGRVGLLDPSKKDSPDDEKATVLSFRNEKGAEVASLWIGKEYKKEEQSQFGTYDQTAGRYVKRPQGDEVFLVSQQFESAKTDPSAWLDKGFFQVNKVKSVERTGSAPEQAWKLVRDSDTADFKLVDAKPGEELDKDKVSSMKNAFSSPSFEDVMVGDAAKKPNKITFKLETFEAFRYEVKLGDKDANNDYLLTVDVSADLPKQRVAPEKKESDEDKKANDKKFEEEQKKLKQKLDKEKRLAGFVYKIKGWVVDSINKERKEILVEKKKDEPKKDEPKKDAASVPGLDSSVPGLAPK